MIGYVDIRNDFLSLDVNHLDSWGIDIDIQRVPLSPFVVRDNLFYKNVCLH